MTQTLAAFNAASIARRMNSAAGMPVLAFAVLSRSIISRGKNTLVRIMSGPRATKRGKLTLRFVDLPSRDARRRGFAKASAMAIAADDSQKDAAKRAVLNCVDGGGHAFLRVGRIPTMCLDYATHTHVATGNCEVQP